MYRTIIVPIDLAQQQKAGEAVDLALRMGEGEARIILSHVLEEVPAYVAYELPKGLLDESRNTATEALKKIAADSGIKADIDVRIGHAANQILELAGEVKADLIIVASHRPGLQDYFIGSTAGRVVRHAQCSVLVTR